MRLFVSVLAASAITLGGCAAFNVAAQPVSQETLAKSAYAAKAAYAVALIGAAQVVATPRCERAPPPCVPQAIVDQVRKFDLAADTATQAAEDAVRNLKNDPTLMQLAVDNATNAVKAFKTISDIYKGGK